MDKEREERKNYRGEIALGGMILLFISYIVSCFGVAEYKGQKMLVYKVGGNRDYYNGNLISTHTLETEYGTITTRRLCRVTISSDRLYRIETRSYGSNTLHFWGTKLPEDISIGFDEYTGEVRAFNTWNDDYPFDMFLGNILLKVEDIWIRNNPDEERFQFYIHESPGRKIELSDGTVIQFLSSLYHVLLYDDGIWYMSGGGYVRTRESPIYAEFLVTLPGEEEGQKYGTVRFKEDWGPFIEGELAER
jgi:hypothetical protein